MIQKIICKSYNKCTIGDVCNSKFVTDGSRCESFKEKTIIEKEDHFEEVEYIENCMICRNKDTDKCSQCQHN